MDCKQQNELQTAENRRKFRQLRAVKRMIIEIQQRKRMIEIAYSPRRHAAVNEN